MSSKLVKTKSLFFIILAVAFFAILSLTQFSAGLFAYANLNYQTTVSLTNSNFATTSYNSTTGNYSPSSWGVIDGSDEAGTKATVIPLTNSNFSEYSTNPGKIEDAEDDYIFMLKSNSTTPTRIGYKNKTAVTLAANGYYKIDVLVYTDTQNNGASIYISGLEETLAIENINTQSTWRTYSFFIKTSAYSSESIFVELWLGSESNVTASGEIFFDNIQIYSYSEDLYTTIYNATPVAFKANELSLRSTYINALPNANFENGLTGWEIISGASNVSDPNDSTYAPGTVIKYNGVGNPTDPALLGLDSTSSTPGLLPSSNSSNTKALYMRNAYPSYVTYQSVNSVTIPQHAFYRLSVFVKIQNITSGGATIKLVQNTTEDKTAIVASLSNITSTTALPQYNGYAEYVFYVQGNPFEDTSLKIQFSLGTDEDNTSDGIVVFDNILIEEVSYNTYNSNKANSQTTSMSMFTTPDTSTILNGAFNFVNTEISDTYPLNPLNWTINDKNSNSGIININKSKFDAQNYPFNNPGTTNYPGTTQNINETLNNVLVISASETGYTEYKSSNFTVASGAITEVSFYVNTQSLSDTEGGFNARIQSGDSTIVSYMQKVFSNNIWTKYSMYIKSGLTSFSANLIIGLGSNENPASSGYVFVDNVAVNSSITEEAYASKILENNPHFAFTNLETNEFSTYSSKNGTVLKPTLLTASKTTDNVLSGILDTSIPNSDNISLREGTSDTHILMIKNLSDDSYSYSTSLGYTLEEGKFYKVSVWINATSITTAVKENEKNKKFAGVNFNINNSDNLFPAIKDTSTGTNGWVQYTYYIKANNANTLKATLGLGIDIATTGYAYFDDLTVVSITENDYNSAEESSTIMKTSVTEDDTDEDPTTPPGYNINYWILIPSLALGVCLIAAILSVSIRKIKINRKIKVKSSEYDRTKSLNADIVKRELAKQREEKILKINEGIKKANLQMAEIKTTYENNLKNLQNKENAQKLFTKYATSNTRIQRELDKLNSALTFVTDENNIRAEELKEIRLRDRKIEIENKIATKKASKESKKK